MQRLPRRITFLTIALAVLAGFSLFFSIGGNVLAQTPFSIENIGSEVGLSTADLRDTVINIIRWVLGILGLVGVGYVIYGGFLYLTSHGNEQQIEKAKQVIVNALIGIAIVLLSFAIVFFVARTFGDVTDGGAQCTDGETRNFGCELCVSNAWVNNPNPPDPGVCSSLGFNEFRLDAVATSFVLPGSNADNVTLCSNVLQDFNNRVLASTVAAAALDPDTPLTIVDLDNAQTTFDGTWQVLNDTVTFRHNRFCTGTPNACVADSDCSEALGETCDIITFLPNTNYQLRIPKAITDTSLDPLAACRALPGCTDQGSYFAWNFTTGSENDTSPPAVTDSYPIRAGSGYPDTNVDRQPLLRVTFSEGIDPASVVDSTGTLNDAHIFLERLDGQGGNVVPVVSETDTDGDGKVDADKWDVTFTVDTFKLSLVNPLALEPFTWYRITVQNIEDLCGNGLSGTETWEFQTNDAIASIVSVYPEGQNQCPGSPVSAVFGTTMWKNTVTFTVSGDANFTITMPVPEGMDPAKNYTVSNADATLRILGADPTDPNSFKVYELTLADDLPANGAFQVAVTTDRVIDTAGNTLERSWEFQTATAETCTCAPQVNSINPASGGPGACVTVSGYCYAGTSANPAEVSLVDIGGIDAGFLGTPTERNIVTSVPETLGIGSHPVKVGITYENAAFGTLSSNTNVEFNVTTTDPSQGPCLIALDPAQGYPTNPVTAVGERFGTNPGAVEFNGAGASIASWSDTEVKTSVPSAASSGFVYLFNELSEKSNGLFFDVLTPPPDMVSVVEAQPTCGEACINTLLMARFNKDIDTATLNTNTFRVRRCQNATCEWNLLDPALGTLVFHGYNAVDFEATFSNTADFVPNTWYRVLLSGGDAGLKSTAGELLAVNFDETGDGIDDAYSWTFKTKDDPEACSVNRVAVNPQTATIGLIGDTMDYVSTAYGSPDTCNPNGQPVDVGDTWAWDLLNLTPAAPEAQYVDANQQDNVAEVEALAETVSLSPPFLEVEACASGFCDTGELRIDVTWCDETTDCADKDGDGVNECPGSVCNTSLNRCEPVINSLSPSDGAIGTWVTAEGCYFSNYDAAKSRVVFTDEKPGLCLNTAICGSCESQWGNSQVIVEVPNESTPEADDDAVTGPVRLETAQGLTADSPTDFTVDPAVIRPGICALEPNSGEPGVTAVDVKGKSFGTSQGSGFVTFSDAQNASVNTWANEVVNVLVPLNAQTGLVTLTQAGVTSNGLNFTVSQGACPAQNTCTVDTDCTPGNACGTGNCCAKIPNVASTNPPQGATDVCRNAGILLTFDQDMNPATLTEANFDVSPGTFTIESVTARSVILNPGLLLENTAYTVTVSSNVQSTKGVNMENDYVLNFTTGTTSCELDRVDVTPAFAEFTTTGASHTLTAATYDANDFLILEVPGVYEWTWSWTGSAPLTADFTLPFEPDSFTQDVVTKTQNGDAVFTATATLDAPNSGTRTDWAVVRLTLPDPPINPCSTTSCTDTSQCSAFPNTGCGTGNCCYPQPTVVSVNPADGAQNVCQNTGILVTFDRPMDQTSLNTSSNYELLNAGVPVSFSISGTTGNTVLLAPDALLDANTQYTIRVANTVQSEQLVSMAADYVTSFTTGGSVCALADVDVLPPFTSETNSGVAISMLANATGSDGNPIVQTPQYTWAWDWGMSNTAIANFSPAPGNNASAIAVTGTTSGTTNATATASVSAPNSGSASGVGVIELTLPGVPPPDSCAAQGLESCVVNSDCTNPATPACGTSGCCVAQPQVASTNPADGANDVCRNSGIRISFDRAMDTTTLSDPANFAVSPGSVRIASVTRDSVLLDVGLLDPTTYSVTVGTGVKSAEGVNMGGAYTFSFTVIDSVCDLNRVELEPHLWTTMTKNDTKDFFANTFAANGNEILEVLGTYDWTWNWETSNSAVAEYTTAFPNDSDIREARTGVVNGTSTLTATATVTQNPSLQPFDTAFVQLNVCENPWSLGVDGIFTDSALNCDIAADGCTDFDFEISYCRGNDAGNLLPDFNEKNIKGQVGTTPQNTVNKQYLFKASGDDDAIGIRILPNPSGLSPEAWYQQQFPFQAGAPQSMVVDGYPAVRDGRTVYVASTLFNGSQLVPYIFLISHNQDASRDTIAIYNAMLGSWRFNRTGLGPADKLAVSHDMMRLADLVQISSYLESYREKNGSYPSLAAGSFIPGISTSRWNQSWNATLGNDLGKTLPIDPLNVFYNCPTSHEQASCWDEVNKNFQCNTNPSPTPGNPSSHIYLYQSDGGNDYTLYANLEYTKAGTWATGAGNPCAGTTGGSTCACFNVTRSSSS